MLQYSCPLKKIVVQKFLRYKTVVVYQHQMKVVLVDREFSYSVVVMLES